MSDVPVAGAPEQSDSKLLNGWKEISAYLGKSPRTAIRWAAELDLPVHRMKGRTGEIVYAVPEEIDAWRRQRESIPADHEVESVAAFPDTLSVSDAPSQWRNPVVWATGLLALVALGWAANDFRSRVISDVSPSSPVAQPASWNVSTNALTVFDDSGRLLWEKRFDFALETSSYGVGPTPFEHPTLIRIADLEGDGNSEVLFIATSPRQEEGKLYCFEHDGRERFRHAPDKPVRFGDETYGPPFTVRHVFITRDSEGAASVWIGASHIPWFPTVLQRLDAKGRVLSEYWSNGHFLTLEELTIAGRRYIAAGGTSNDDGSASLAVLDYDHATGRAPTARSRYVCASCPQDDPVHYFLFPRMELARLTDSRPFVTEIRPQPDGGFWVTVLQARVDILKRTFLASVYYRFNSGFELVGQEFGDEYAMAHRALESKGAIPHSLGTPDLRQLLPVRGWSTGAFREEAKIRSPR